MQLSYKIKRLLIISIAVIILAIAANEGHKSQEEINKEITSNPPSHYTYPNVPLDMDPSIFDMAIDDIADLNPPTPVVKQIVPSPRSTGLVISAEAYLVANLDTGEIYAEHNTRNIFPIASLSKLITALIALHSMQPDQKITITQAMLDAGYGEAGHLVLGEILTVTELLYPLLLESSNDAAEAIAQSYGYPTFLQNMNSFTIELGMTSTFFKDASGLSAGNISTANNLLILARFLYANEKPLLEITRLTKMVLATTTDHGSHTFITINPFPLDPHFIGGKTGRTNEAKESMISLFRYEHRGITYPVAVIVLRSDFKARELDSNLLFERFLQKIWNI